MGRLNVTHLKPRHKFRNSKRAGSRPNSFTEADARDEDRLRAKLIRASLKQLPEAKRKAAKRLARKLIYDGDPPRTLASSGFHFGWRECILDNHVRLTWRLAQGKVATAALLPTNLKLRSLDEFDSFKFKERLRADLDRVKGQKARGGIFAGPHGEYDADLDEWRPHYHLLIIGREMMAVVDRLREKGKYTLASTEDADHSTSQAPPIVIKRVKRHELRYALSYVLQTWWPKRWRGLVSTGDQKRSHRRYRIPGVKHTEWLLWADRQELHHLYLLYGLEVGRKGLRLSKRRKTRTSMGAPDDGGR